MNHADKRFIEAARDFTWGEVLDIFSFDLDGKTCTIIKYHPWRVSENGVIRRGVPDKDKVLFSNDVTSWSDHSIEMSLLRFIAHEHLGLNQHPLVEGLGKALGLPQFFPDRST